MDPFAIFAFAVVTVGQFLWARYSRLARTRAAVVTTAVMGSLLLILFGLARFSMIATVVDEPLGAGDLLVFGLFVLAYLAATAAGWFLRERQITLGPPG